MTTEATAPDATMEAIARAVTQARTGDPAPARRTLLDLWTRLGTPGDPLHRCSP